VLRFVAESAPELGLEVVRLATAPAIRAALRERELSVGSFETGPELLDAALNPSGKLVSAGQSVTLPLAFYSRKLRSLSELGPGSRVALPDHGDEQGRALLVLYHYGLLLFDEGLGPRVRLGDVRANPRRLELVTRARSQLARELDDSALVGLGYDGATALGLAPAREALALEDGFSPFAQVLTVRREDRDARAGWLERFVRAYRAPAVKEFILRRYQDSVRRAW
jgi:YaeC family lipoprotein